MLLLIVGFLKYPLNYVVKRISGILHTVQLSPRITFHADMVCCHGLSIGTHPLIVNAGNRLMV